ncbi:MAG TPA: GFA family protein [Devosia sp.]|nr:GFA family protein [Devosia sp.]
MKLPQFPVDGGCQCGAVRYRLKAAPLGVYACHCKDCQRFSGTTHTISMVVRAGDAELMAGALTGFDKAADSGRTVRMLGCAQCGTKIWNEPLSSAGLLIVKPGTLDDASWARPVGNIWTDRALPWVQIDWSQPHFPRQPPDRQPLFDAYAAELAKG